jgi:phage shock protein E
MSTSTLMLAIAVLVILAFVWRSVGGGGGNSKIVHDKIKAGALVVDVRTPGEFASEAYPGATNIPLSEVGKRLAEFGDRKRSVVVYCRSGSRSGQAKAILEKNGFADVTNGGGIAGMPAR